MISALIRAVTDAGLNKFFYNLFFALGFVVIIIYTLRVSEKYGIKRGSDCVGAGPSTWPSPLLMFCNEIIRLTVR